MPTYDYACTKCERTFEVFHSITSKPMKTIATDCAKCKNKAPVQRLIGSGGAVIFKGSGFYETDYRSENYKKSEKAEKESAKGGESGKGEKADKGTSGDSGSKSTTPKAKESGGKKADKGKAE